jgi:hypothetical protein
MGNWRAAARGFAVYLLLNVQTGFCAEPLRLLGEPGEPSAARSPASTSPEDQARAFDGDIAAFRRRIEPLYQRGKALQNTLDQARRRGTPAEVESARLAWVDHNYSDEVTRLRRELADRMEARIRELVDARNARLKTMGEDAEYVELDTEWEQVSRSRSRSLDEFYEAQHKTRVYVNTAKQAAADAEFARVAAESETNRLSYVAYRAGARYRRFEDIQRARPSFVKMTEAERARYAVLSDTSWDIRRLETQLKGFYLELNGSR